MQALKTLGGIVAVVSLLMLSGCNVNETEAVAQDTSNLDAKAADTSTPSVPRYTVTALGTLGGSDALVSSINNKGQVVGYSLIPGKELYGHAFLWDKGKMTDLGAMGGKRSSANDINDRGQIVGYVGYMAEQPDPLALLWQDGKAQYLIPRDRGYSSARAINNRGQVVGQSLQGTFLWDEGKITSLGTLSPNSINDKGQVVGAAKTPGGTNHAFLWNEGDMIDLGTLGGDTSRATAINNAGQVVGYAWTADRLDGEASQAQKHAFLWSDGKMQDLGTLSDGRSSEALAINNRGEIVGNSEIPNPGTSYESIYWVRRAFLYRDGKMHNLNDLIPATSDWILMSAEDINDAGQIVCYGNKKKAQASSAYALLLTPVAD